MPGKRNDATSGHATRDALLDELSQFVRSVQGRSDGPSTVHAYVQELRKILEKHVRS